jgi:hypothetical protein
MKRTFQLAALAACAVVFLCASLADVQAGDLPDQLTKLLPDNAEVVLLVPSLNEAQRLWDEVRVLVTEIDPEEGEDMPPFAELLGSIPEPYGEALDWTRPLALGINVPNMMAGQQANYSIALPVLKSDADWQGLSQMVQMPTVMEQDGYLLISSLPEYTPGQGPTDLLSNLAAGTVQAAVDMEKLWAVFGPMVDFGLAMAAQPKAGPDGQPAEPARKRPRPWPRWCGISSPRPTSLAWGWICARVTPCSARACWCWPGRPWCPGPSPISTRPSSCPGCCLARRTGPWSRRWICRA